MATRARDRRSTAMAAVTLVASAFLAVGVMTLFHACAPKDDGTWMSCHYAQLVVCGLACAMAALSLVALVVRHRAAAWLHAAVAALAVVAAFVPGGVIHLCMMAGMRCRAVMRPSVVLTCVVIAACALASALFERGRRRA